MLARVVAFAPSNAASLELSPQRISYKLTIVILCGSRADFALSRAPLPVVHEKRARAAGCIPELPRSSNTCEPGWMLGTVMDFRF